MATDGADGLNQRDAVLFANEAFYLAFADGDFEGMADLWADSEQIACIHPGWPPLYGRAEVLGSWQGILANPQQPAVRCRDARAFVRGDEAFVLCYEEIAGSYLIATNIFTRVGKAWRLVHHQAGPTNGQPEDGDATPPSLN